MEDGVCHAQLLRRDGSLSDACLLLLFWGFAVKLILGKWSGGIPLGSQNSEGSSGLRLKARPGHLASSSCALNSEYSGTIGVWDRLRPDVGLVACE